VPIVLPLEEWELLKRLAAGARRINELASELNARESDLMRYIASLEAKGLLKVIKRRTTYYELSDEGREYLSKGLPEERLISYMLGECKEEECAVELIEVFKRLGEDVVRIALANLGRYNVVKVIGGRLVANRESLVKLLSLVKEKRASLERLQLTDELAREFLRRRLIIKRELTEILVEPTKRVDPTGRLDGEEVVVKRYVTALRSEDLRSGRWRELELKPFDLNIEYPRLDIAVPHFMREIIEMAKEIMVGLGFEEEVGPIVEYEFWNFDALFQAQDHPAREVHDTFFVEYEGPREGLDERLLYEVARAHEDGGGTGSIGWRYKWDVGRALRLVMRSQTTAVSVRALAARGDGEYRMFSIGRVYRYERIDPKHNIEFHQLDGIVVGRGLTFRNLLGVLEQIMREFGMEAIRFRPAYFPFTSPSAEVHAKHPKLGWIEVGGSGIFRPEVVKPLGVKECRVLAFGLGFDRIAMILLGIDDIRDIFTHNIHKIKSYYPRFVEAYDHLASRSRP